MNREIQVIDWGKEVTGNGIHSPVRGTRPVMGLGSVVELSSEREPVSLTESHLHTGLDQISSEK